MSTAAEPVTAEAVGQLFRDCWPKMQRYPDAAACHFVAIAIRIVRDRPRNKHPDRPPPAALKHARMFLQHAGEMDARLQRERSGLEPAILFHEDGSQEREYFDRARYDKCLKAITRIAEAQRAVQDVIEAWENRDPWFVEGEEPVKWIARHAEEAWRRTSHDRALWGKWVKRPDAESPNMGRYEGSNLALFVRGALNLIGLSAGEASISKTLLGAQKSCRLNPLGREDRRSGRPP